MEQQEIQQTSINLPCPHIAAVFAAMSGIYDSYKDMFLDGRCAKPWSKGIYSKRYEFNIQISHPRA